MNPPIAIADATQQSPKTRWALASLALSMLLSSLGTSIANVGLPTLAQAFDATFQQVQWVVIAYLLAITTLIVSAGRLGDILGRRRLLLGGIALFTLASVFCGLAPSLGGLIAARALQGLGAAIMLALSMALVGETVSKAKTGSAMGLLGTMSAIGTALGPSLGGVLISGFGWRSMFLISVPLGLAAWLFARRYLPADRSPTNPIPCGFDWLGTLLLALSLAAYALAMTLGRGPFGFLNCSLLSAAVVGIGLFVFHQSTAAAPLLRLSLFRDRLLSASLAMNVSVAAVMMATLVVGPFYLAYALGLNQAVVGMALAVGPVVAALAGVPAGRMADRLGARRMILAGLAAMALGCIALSAVPLTFGIGGYVAPMIILTLGYALFQSANNTAVMADVALDQRGVIAALLNLSRNLGLITGASALAAAFAFAAHTVDISSAHPDAIAQGMRFTFAVALGLIAMALIIGLANQRPENRRDI